MVFLQSPVFWIAALLLVILAGRALRRTFGPANQRINRDLEFLRQLPPKNPGNQKGK